MKRVFVYVGLAGLGVILVSFVVSCLLIGWKVREQCGGAKKMYEGDCVEALTGVLEDEGNPYGVRNSAIWALGQLGDRRALPVLEKLYTGDIPEREPWDETISQYGLSKAIRLARGGFNATAVFWRNGLSRTALNGFCLV